MTTDSNIPKSPLVTIVAYDGLCMFEFGIALEVFGLPRPEFDRWYRHQIIAIEEGPLTTMGHLTIEAPYDLAALEQSDLIILPGWRGIDQDPPHDFKQALIRAHNKGAKIATICSAVTILASCKLLEGKKVTTHWRYVDLLQKKYPDLLIDPDVLYIDEGDILTSAGSSAGLDLCLYLVAQDFGQKYANEVARRLVLPAHRNGGQIQYIPRPISFDNQAGDIAPLLDQIKGSLEEEWSLNRMAELANLSPRSLLRKFKNSTGETPKNWLTLERLSLAKELLEVGSLSVSEIAYRTGFMTQETLRHHFRRHVGTSPLNYRSQFQC
ncbi:MAG: transcriptional regulator FtrA [Motiliproteus sp.]